MEIIPASSCFLKSLYFMLYTHLLEIDVFLFTY